MPNLPSIVEFIESIPRPDGGFVSEHGGGQVIIPVFPPGITIGADIFPEKNAYAMVCFRIALGTAMVPGAFTGEIQQRGSNYYTGTVSGAVIRDGLSFLMFVTQAHPLHIALTNNSALAQYFEEIYEFALIGTKNDYDIIMEALKDRANEGWTDALLLLKEMAKNEGIVVNESSSSNSALKTIPL